MPRIKPSRNPVSFAGYWCGKKSVGISPRSQQRTHLELRLAEEGAVTLLLGGREVHLPAHRLAAFWSGIPHQVLAHNTGQTWLVRIPLGWLLERNLPAPFVDGLLEGRVFFEPDVDHFECDLYRLGLWSGQSAVRNRTLAKATELETEARLIRLAATLPSPLPKLEPPAAANRQRPDTALQLAAQIARDHAQPFSIGGFSDAAGLHRNYAMHLFRQKLGTSLVEYLTQHRLAHAMRLLIKTGLPIREVARQSGFGSEERLRTTFREAFKESPIVFRRHHRMDPQPSGAG